MPKTIRLILGDQLNAHHSWFATASEDVCYVLMEIRSETDYVQHHIQKVLAIFGAMRRFAVYLRQHGHQAHYITLDDPENAQNIGDNLLRLVEGYGATKVEYLLPDEYRVDQYLQKWAKEQTFPVDVVDTEHFLTSRSELSEIFKGKKTYLMETFYRKMRQKHGVLMEGHEPVSGRWNYDAENRKKLPKSTSIPPPCNFRHGLAELEDMLKIAGVKTLGNSKADAFPWPLDRAESLQVLEYFVAALLPQFGTYQDAMHSEEPFIYHSRLSFALNVKLLHPLEVVRRVEQAYLDAPEEIGLAQAEGFIRQIIGWREYMRGIYWAHMPEYATRNYFDHKAELPSWFWTADTKMNCLKHAIGQSLDHAYAHHIQRLMVTGNFALLAGIHPSEVDAWYLGIYIDAFEWVEITNTRGMSQFADGGLVGTKPYVSSANYMHKMSNYCQGCVYDHKKKHGDGACPFNSLYWHFYDRHRDKLANNPRIGMMYRTWDRMAPEEKGKILEQASHYLDTIEDL